MSDFSIRPMRESDEPFIYKAWLEGYWPHFPGNIVVPKGEFMQRWHGIIERILADDRTRTVVAHVDGQPDTLLGFACGNDRCLHWAYVKQAFRRYGWEYDQETGEVTKRAPGIFLDMLCDLDSQGVRCFPSDRSLEYGRISHWSGGRPYGAPPNDWTLPYAPELLKEYA